MHRHSPVRLDQRLPDLWENDLPAWSQEVIMAIGDMRPNDSNVEECISDEFFHALKRQLVPVWQGFRSGLTAQVLQRW